MSDRPWPTRPPVITEQQWLGNWPPAPLTITVENLSVETMALLAGVHPGTFDPEGRALVQAIHDRKKATE